MKPLSKKARGYMTGECGRGNDQPNQTKTKPIGPVTGPESVGEGKSVDTKLSGDLPRSLKCKKEKEFLQQIESERKVFLKNLHQKLSSEQVYEILKEFGPIMRLKIPFNKSKNRNLGYGYAIFEEVASVQRVLEKNGQIAFQGKAIQFVKFAKEDNTDMKQEASTKVENEERDSKGSREGRELPSPLPGKDESVEERVAEDDPFEGILNPSMSLHHRFLKPTQREYHLLRPSGLLFERHNSDNLKFTRHHTPKIEMATVYRVKCIPAITCKGSIASTKTEWHPLMY